MTEIIDLEDIDKFKDLSKELSDLHGIPAIDIRLTITISGSRGIMNTYKLEMLRGKDWVELYLARGMPGILKTMQDLIDITHRQKESNKIE